MWMVSENMHSCDFQKKNLHHWRNTKHFNAMFYSHPCVLWPLRATFCAAFAVKQNKIFGDIRVELFLLLLRPVIWCLTQFSRKICRNTIRTLCCALALTWLPCCCCFSHPAGLFATRSLFPSPDVFLWYILTSRQDSVRVSVCWNIVFKTDCTANQLP